ncbi:LysE family translocator [Rhizobium halophytocola]|uniref:Threonine/homoserine/homoserine lactone efflux protein n=1 Tax=Rhizobium halophytocola TaxID=735519 RepID=A0ABS4DWN3_9HYPH|nr:LysE family transporter [Rhizobium halophytocola]MBP1850106.1 threonine/homoserine/homoserine lactone efflux protein [Rhizobium halophytocola]
MVFILSVVAIWTVAAITPGPNFFLTVRTVLESGRSAGMASAAGTVVGTICWGIAGWFGVSAVFAVAPYAYVFLKLLGGTYLIWLGLRVLVRLRRGETADAGTVERPRPDFRRNFLLGLATNLANPKTALFVASLFMATLPRNPDWLHGASAVAIMAVVSTLWYTVVLSALSHPKVLAGYRRGRKWVDAAAGAIFVGFGLRLLASAR